MLALIVMILVLSILLFFFDKTETKCPYDKQMFCENHGKCERCAFKRWIDNGRD